MDRVKEFTILTIIFIACIIIIEIIFSPQYITMENIASSKPNFISILTANVGNLNLGCRNVLNKLCYKDVEERISINIKALSPDIIALQEILAPWQCTKKEKNKNKVCYETQVVPQARRLVGDNYTIICNSRNQFECVAVKLDTGKILGCKPGSICDSARTAPEIQGCDNGFTVSAATVRLKTGGIFDIVNFHPQSTDAHCRAQMISTAFEGTKTSPPLIQENKVILLGDLNLDPWRDTDESAITWMKFIDNGWKGKEFVYHSGVIEYNPPYPTSFSLFRKKTVDIVVSNFSKGTCTVLGESTNTTRLDGGKGTDHRAVFGILTISP